MPSDYRIKFIADVSFVEEMRAEIALSLDEIKIEKETTEDDATRLGFDLMTAVAVVTLVSGALDILQFAAKVYRWFEKSKSNRVIIQTPFKTVELVKASGVTRRDVEKILKAAIEI
jgi:hypothetical protein